MNRKIALAASAAFLSVVALSAAAPAHADINGIKIGTLTCNVDSGWGFVFGSTRDVKCVYTNSSGGAEHYVGHVNKFGVDIGYHGGALIAWGVFAPADETGKGALAGAYGGATASAAAGVGVGANILVGGFQNSFTLQPLSVEGTTGLNVAAGIAELNLKYEP